MKRLVFLLASLAALAASAARAAPLELYGRLPSIEQVAVSPGGDDVALIWTDGDQRRIAIERLADHKVTELLGVGAAKVRYLQWAGPRHLLITMSKTARIDGVLAPRAEYFMAFDFNRDTQKLRPLLDRVADTLNTIESEPEVRIIDGQPVVFVQGVQFVSGQGVVSVFRISLDRDIEKITDTGLFNTRDWVIGADGTAVAQTVWDDKSGRWQLRTRQPGVGWKTARELRSLNNTPEMIGLGRDGRSVLMKQSTEAGDDEFREVAPDGAWSDPLPIKDADDAIYDPASHKLIGYHALVGDQDDYTFFDPHDAVVWRAVANAYPGQRVQLVSWSDDRQKIAVRVDSLADGPAYALVDLASRNARWLGQEYEKLTPADIAPVLPVTYKAQDGLELHGYLTVPVGAKPDNLPLVVFPHGGPAARDELGFDWWAQAMASRGYAVLQVNYRGSDGYGWKFLSAGFGEWGRKMQTDLSDGVRYLASQHVIDPKRVCIVGASYGGYAALAGMTLDTGVYRCAVAVAGPTDMRRFIDWAANQNGISSQRYWLNFMGAEKLRDPSLGAISPALHADKVQGPILLIHGKDDTVVPIEQSREMASALKAAGKPAELVTLDSTDHWLTKGETRLVMLQKTMAFLEKNNPPK